jgi:NAD(P)-dependent dehydrogenase (short-subunit alcohol dehydrogenase family)
MDSNFTDRRFTGTNVLVTGVAHWIIALADPQVTWVTGQVVGIDGGMSLT